MINQVEILRSLFCKLSIDKPAFLEINQNGYTYRQVNLSINLPSIYFDIKRAGVLNIKDITNNINVLNKLSGYQEQNKLITSVPTKFGFYFQVFNEVGDLIYAQEIKFTSFNWFLNWLAMKRLPELTLKVKRL